MTKQSKTAAILQRALTEKPYGCVTCFKQHKEIRTILADVLELRRKGKQTVGMSQLHRMLMAEYPQYRPTYKSFRDHIVLHMGGWPEVGS
jgi:hypothetical protein